MHLGQPCGTLYNTVHFMHLAGKAKKDRKRIREKKDIAKTAESTRNPLAETVAQRPAQRPAFPTSAKVNSVRVCAREILRLQNYLRYDKER